jgi:predicted dehydrogenase
MLQGNDNVKLVAMADVFPDKLKMRRSQLESLDDESVRSKVDVDDDHTFVGFNAYKEILATDIDVLIEGTLPYSRPKHVAAAVDAGKHVFMEKPVAVDPTGIRVIIAAAERARTKGLSMVAGTQRRHQRPYIETMKKIHDGAIGDIVAARAYWCGGLPFARERAPEWTSDLEYMLRNWYGHCWVAGDSIVEQHVHNLDVINWAIGAHPVSVFASGGRTWKPDAEKFGDIYDHFSCDFEYPNGVHMTSMCRHWTGSGGVFEDFLGTKGRSSGRDMGEKEEISPYVQEHIDLVKSIRNEGPHLNEGVQVAHSTLTAIMGRMSAYTGEKISWDDALNSDLNLVPETLDFDRAYPVGNVPAPGAHKL